MARPIYTTDYPTTEWFNTIVSTSLRFHPSSPSLSIYLSFSPVFVHLFIYILNSFLEHIGRIAGSDYVPTEKDVLALHVETTAAEETIFKVQDIRHTTLFLFSLFSLLFISFCFDFSLYLDRFISLIDC